MAKARRQSNEHLENRIGDLESPEDVELYLDGGNGHGSTGTTTRRFSNIRKSTGNGVYYTYTDSATDGMSVTIHVPGLYGFEFSDSSTVTGVNVGITVNSSSLATNVGSISYAGGRRIFGQCTSLNEFASASGFIKLNVGDVVRAQTANTPNNTNDTTYFKMIRIGN